MRTLYRPYAPALLKAGEKQYEKIPNSNENTRVTLKEVFEINFIRLITIPHKNLSLEKRKMFKANTYYYKERK